MIIYVNMGVKRSVMTTGMQPIILDILKTSVFARTRQVTKVGEDVSLQVPPVFKQMYILLCVMEARTF